MTIVISAPGRHSTNFFGSFRMDCLDGNDCSSLAGENVTVKALALRVYTQKCDDPRQGKAKAVHVKT